MKKIAIHGGYGMDNFGDESILASMIVDIRGQCDVDITVFSWNPEQTARLYNVKAVNGLTDVLGILRTLREVDLFISGGGGQLQDSTSFLNVPFQLSKVVLAKILGKPVMFYSHGIGPLNTKLGKLLTRYIVNRVNLITVRDEKSREILESIGVTRPPIYITADPALTLSPIKSEDAKTMLLKEGIDKENHPLVGIAVGRLFHMGHLYLQRKKRKFLSVKKVPKFEEFKINIAQAADHVITNLDANVVFIPMHRGPDIDTSLEVIQLMKHKDKAKILMGEYSPRELKSIIGQMDLAIGMRFHFLILASGVNVPIVGLIYAPKVESFLEMICPQERSVRVEDIRLEELLEKIDDTWNSREQIRKELKPKVEALKRKALLNAELTKKLMKC